MRLFKAWYQAKKKGNEPRKVKPKNKQTKNWYIELRDHRGILRRIPAFGDKPASEALGRKIERLVSFKVAGEQPDPQLSRWLDQIPDKVCKQLVRIGLLDRTRAAAGKTLSEHIDDFQKFLGGSTHHAKKRSNAIRKIFNACGFKNWNDISASKVWNYLVEQRDSGALAQRTFNDRVGAVKHFCRWMVRDRRATESPVGYLKTETVTENVHERRPLEPDQVRRLLETTKFAPKRFKLTGPERAMLYRLAIETGLRRNELKSLTVSCFDLDAKTVTLKPRSTKNKKNAKLPLRPDTVKQLQPFLAVKTSDAQVFDVPINTADMIKADEADAGIPYVDSEGRHADFHALRHTTGSWLAANNVHPKVAQAIMRHSDINLSMSRYSHVMEGQEAEAVARLPDLSLSNHEDQRESGDFAVENKEGLVGNLPTKGGKQRISTDPDEQTTLPDILKKAVSDKPSGVEKCQNYIRDANYPDECKKPGKPAKIQRQLICNGNGFDTDARSTHNKGGGELCKKFGTDAKALDVVHETDQEHESGGTEHCDNFGLNETKCLTDHIR